MLEKERNALKINDISHNEISIHLEEVINSKPFVRSETNRKLLTYLVESTLANKEVKEFTIASEVFNQTADSLQNSKVRVYIHNLRKKLEEYYNEEGKNCSIKLDIPKGCYCVQFLRSKKERRINFSLLQSLFIALLIGVIVFLLLKHQRCDAYKASKHPFWSNIADNGKKTIVVAGDYFFYKDTVSPSLNIRNPKINNKAQLKALGCDNLTDAGNVTYMPRDAFFCMPNLIPILHEAAVDYQLILSSEFEWRYFRDDNMIYIGSYKNLYSLSVLFKRLGLSFDRFEDELIYNNGTNEYKYKIRFSDSNTIDPVVVFKIPGPSGNTIHFFASNHDIGCISSVQELTRTAQLKQLYNSLNTDDDYFVAIYTAQGLARTDISLKLNKIHIFDDNELIQLWKK